jgi:hypothetical protein
MESLIWVLEGQQGNNWRHGFVPIQPSGRYQIVIEGMIHLKHYRKR